MKFGKVLGERTIVGAAMVRLYDRSPVNGAPVPVELSIALTVKLNVPAAVGVPLSWPLVESARPAGSAPEAMAYV